MTVSWHVGRRSATTNTRNFSVYLELLIFNLQHISPGQFIIIPCLWKKYEIIGITVKTLRSHDLKNKWGTTKNDGVGSPVFVFVWVGREGNEFNR